MSRVREQIAVAYALGRLRGWYSIWEAHRNNRSGEMRRLALSAKCLGLVWHDRTLAVLCGGADRGR